MEKVKPLVKLCGFRRPGDVEQAVELGADFLGFVLAESRRRLDWADLPGLVARVRPPTAWVAVLVDPSWSDVQRCLDLQCGWIQLHGREPAELCQRVRAAGARLIKAVRRGQEADYRSCCDFFLYDGARPGSGETTDWSRLPSGRDEQYFLAGGLTPENVAEAVERLRPYAVDVASGVEEAPGCKSRARMELFLERARAS